MRTRRIARGGSGQLAPEAFFDAAFKIVGEDGHERLTVDSLCARLSVSRGSFYHHFANTTEFIVRLLQCWEYAFEQYVQVINVLADPVCQIEALWPTIVSGPHEAEGALRSWANSNPIVAATVRRMDQKLEATISEWLVAFIDDPERRRAIVFMAMCLLAGMQRRPQPLDRDLMLGTVLEFLRTNLGIELEVEGERIRVLAMPEPGVGGGIHPTK